MPTDIQDYIEKSVFVYTELDEWSHPDPTMGFGKYQVKTGEITDLQIYEPQNHFGMFINQGRAYSAKEKTFYGLWVHDDYLGLYSLSGSPIQRKEIPIMYNGERWNGRLWSLVADTPYGILATTENLREFNFHH